MGLGGREGRRGERSEEMCMEREVVVVEVLVLVVEVVVRADGDERGED